VAAKEQVAFKQTIGPMVLAPLGSMTVTTIMMWGRFQTLDSPPLFDPSGLVVINFFVAVVSYAAELLFVVPVVLRWPSMRQPRLWVGVVWGTLVGWCFPIVAWAVVRMLPPAPSVQGNGTLRESLLSFLWFGVMGAASGLVFALAARPRLSEPSI
jgi:hypothetical protein